jgi:hypothetical protein
MDTIPHEIITHIISFIEDKIYVSIVCKSWARIVDDMVTIQISDAMINMNDSYSLKKYCKKEGHFLCNIYFLQDMNKFTTNYNSVRFLAYMSYKMKDINEINGEYSHLVNGYTHMKFAYEILYKCSIYDYVFPSEHMIVLMKCVTLFYCHNKLKEKATTLMDTAFKHKSLNVITIMLLYGQWSTYWGWSIESRYKDKIDCENQLIEEIEFLHSLHIMSYYDIYKCIQESNLGDSIKTPVLQYIFLNHFNNNIILRNYATNPIIY